MDQHGGIKADIGAEERSGAGKESAMKTALFPFVVLIHAFSMLLGMASLSFLVFIPGCQSSWSWYYWVLRRH